MYSAPRALHELCRGIVCSVDLQSAFNTLDEAQQGSDDEDHQRDPERIPLRSVSSIIPPLPHRAGRLIVVRLLENHQPVPPITESLDLATIRR